MQLGTSFVASNYLMELMANDYFKSILHTVLLIISIQKLF